MDRGVRALALLAVALLLSGCSWKGTGTVVDREYDDPDTKLKEKCTTQTTGTIKTRKCKTVREYESAEWSLLIRDEKDGKEHWLDVSEREYNAHPEGSTYRRS
jgi:hypothetical protein